MYSSEEVENLYNEYWESVFADNEQTIAYWGTARTLGRLTRDNSEILLHCVAVIEGFYDPEKNTLSDLSKLYKEYINGLDRTKLTAFIKMVFDYAKLYRDKVHVFDSSDLFEYKDNHKRLFHILSVCDVSTFHPYILFLYRKFAGNEPELEKALKKLEIFIMRRAVCNSETKHYNVLCKSFISDSSKIDAALAETPDSGVKAGLASISNKTAALVLFWVELYRRKIDNRYDRDELKYTYTLEHIMPQKWEEFWSEVPVIGDDGNVVADIEAAKQYRYKQIYSIGNMTLLKSSLNTALRNYEFRRKVEGEGRKRGIKHYAELGITKLDVVAPYDAGNQIWDETRIRERTDQITNNALAIWTVNSETQN
jgi:hypothetical protein